MSEVGAQSSIHVEYRLRPDEQMLYTLRFGRLYRILGPLGGVVLVAVVLGIAPDWIWLLLPVGIALVLAFVWVPFTTKFGATAIIVDAASDGLTFAAGGVTSQSSWGAIRSVRRVGQAIASSSNRPGSWPSLSGRSAMAKWSPLKRSHRQVEATRAGPRSRRRSPSSFGHAVTSGSEMLSPFSRSAR